jgi:hypothetical protein
MKEKKSAAFCGEKMEIVQHVSKNAVCILVD